MNLLDDTNQNDQIQIDPNKNYLEELVGDGKKFKTIEDLARGKAESDMYIDHFKHRHDELREDYTKLRNEYNAGPSLKELIDEFKASKQSQDDRTQSDHEDKSAFNPEDIERLVEAKLTAAEQRKREQANYDMVEGKLKEEYGENYKFALKKQVDTLGLTTDFVNDLARKHPQVLFKTLGVGERRGDNFQSPPSSSNKADPFAPSTPKRTWSYYQKMRKDNPSLYRDPKIQDQMFKDALALGDSFQDGDWRALG